MVSCVICNRPNISIHALLAESDFVTLGVDILIQGISIHALLAESDSGNYNQTVDGNTISIHALLAESDNNLSIVISIPPLFLSTLSLRRATNCKNFIICKMIFLSTLSLRRATSAVSSTRPSLTHFYPRSPCGERLLPQSMRWALKLISIHALLAESDRGQRPNWGECLISIHALLAESDNHNLNLPSKPIISIHALLAESDSKLAKTSRTENISIHALLAESDRTGQFVSIPNYYFYPRSPCGERRGEHHANSQQGKFLSTLSLRRATAKVHKTVGHFCAYETNFMEIASSC